MAWSKEKQILESFLCPALIGRVEYLATSYRYLPNKPGRCYITVDKSYVFKMNDITTLIKWYKTEQEVKNDPEIEIPIKNEEIEVVRKETGGKVPEERLRVIVKNRKIAEYAKVLLKEQDALSKSDFNTVSTRFLSTAIEECLECDEILLNILALVDRRLGKKRLLHMAEGIKGKHPIVQFFYKLRVSTFG